MAEIQNDTRALRNRDLEERRQMPVSDRISDVLGDILYDADDLLDLLRSESVNGRYASLRDEVQCVYDSVKTMMERLSN